MTDVNAYADSHYPFISDVAEKVSNHGSLIDWKTWENGSTYSSQGILNILQKSQGILLKILEKSGNFTQNTGKVPGKFSQILFHFSLTF